MFSALEFYAGIGGLHLALQRSGVDAHVLAAFDWDPLASQVYRANHPTTPVVKADILSLTAVHLQTYNADLWLLSPACQPYTVLNPHAKGAADPRAKSFLHLMQKVLPDLASSGDQPKYILIENVAGFETSTTRQSLLKTLQILDYATCEILLTPMQFGIPNSRLRYYLLARLDSPPAFSQPSEPILRHIPGCGSDWIDPRESDDREAMGKTCPLKDYLDPDDDELWKTYAIPDKVLQRWGRLFDIVLSSQKRSCCFTRGYTNLVERTGSILQLNQTLDTTEVFNQFLAAQEHGDINAVRILDPLRLRYFSPTELLRLFSFLPEVASPVSPCADFVWPADISTKSKYKLVGNSVNVRVVTELINFLFR